MYVYCIYIHVTKMSDTSITVIYHGMYCNILSTHAKQIIASMNYFLNKFCYLQLGLTTVTVLVLLFLHNKILSMRNFLLQKLLRLYFL